MWIAIRLPQLPLEIFLRGSSTPEPFALEERHRVFACDRKALARGVRAGMAVAAAFALAPRLRVAPRDPATETEALLGVAGWAAQFTPGVALEFPDGVLLEVSGSLKLFGGLESLLGRLRQAFVYLGDFARNRRVNVRHGFYRFDRAKRLALLDVRAHFRKIDINDVAQFLLRMVCDADGAHVARDAHPLVLLGVAQVLRKTRHVALLGLGARTLPCLYIGRPTTAAGDSDPRVRTSTFAPVPACSVCV